MSTYQDLFSLHGRRALLIGAGGLGRAAGLALAAQGAEIVCADREVATAEAAAEAVVAAGGRATAVGLDTTDADGLDRHVGEMGDLDVAVLTAAMNVRKRLLDYTAEEFDRVVGLNLRGTFNVLRAVGSRMTARGRGSIIAFSSVRARTVEPGQGVYAATKSGLESLVRAAAVEFGESGVRVNAIAPGVVETPLTAQIKADPDWYQAYARKGALGRWAQPSELVGAVVYLAADASSYVTGSTLTVDGGWTAVDGRFTPPT